MSSLVLLIICVVVFVLGYRFYSRLLALGVFRLDVNYSTPAQSLTDDKDIVVSNRQVILGHHVAIIAGPTTIVGSAVAVIWGWIPAVLWVLVGTTVAAGVYGLGSFWLAVRHGGLGLTGMVCSLMSTRARVPFAILGVVVLLIMNAVLAWLVAELLSTYPSAVLAFWLQILLACGFGWFLRRRGPQALIPATVVVLVGALLIVWIFAKIPFAFSGALNIDFRGYSVVSLDATAVWVVLLFVATYYTTRLPIWKLTQARGYLLALQTSVLLIVLFAGVVVLQPPVVAPNFNTAIETPTAIPWIFVTLTSGAIAGFYLLMAGGITAKQLARETDAQYVGFGSALVDGLLAFSVIVVCTAGFNSHDEWMEFYASWEGVQDLPQLIGIYISGIAKFASALGIDFDLAQTFAAVVVAGLIAVTLEAGIRVQHQLLVEVNDNYQIVSLRDQKTLLIITVLVAAMLALHDGRGQGGLALWPLFGLWNQVLAVFGLFLIGLALRRRQQAVGYVFVPMIFLLVVTSWALILQLIRWWASADWLLIAGGILLLVVGFWLVWEALRTLRKSVPALDTSLVESKIPH